MPHGKKTVLTLEKTKVRTEISKVLTVFSKVRTVFPDADFAKAIPRKTIPTQPQTRRSGLFQRHRYNVGIIALLHGK